MSANPARRGRARPLRWIAPGLLAAALGVTGIYVQHDREFASLQDASWVAIAALALSGALALISTALCLLAGPAKLQQRWAPCFLALCLLAAAGLNWAVYARP